MAIYKNALFHTQHLELTDEIIRKHDTSLALALNEKLLETLQHPSEPNLRSAAVTFGFLEGLVSSGLLETLSTLKFTSMLVIVILCSRNISQQYHSFRSSFRLAYMYAWWSIGLLRKGSSLLPTAITIAWHRSSRYSYNDLTWEYAKLTISWFSSCDLNRFSIAARGYNWSDPFVSSLSRTFLHLQQLSINYVSSSSII